MTTPAIAVVVREWEPRDWAAAMRAANPGRPVVTWPDISDRDAVGYALAWHPPEGALERLPNLRVIFSLGAGVDHLLRDTRLPPHVPIVRVVSPDLTRRMTEWTVWQVLAHHRQAAAYRALQADGVWRELRQPAASEVRVGIMGMGVIGRDTAEVLVRIGFQVAGWSRSRPVALPGVQGFTGEDERAAFLARTDILVSLLPLTPDTRGILAAPLFRQLARDGALGAPVVINGGRGGSQSEADILAALDDGTLGGASLDVFAAEPLPAASPLWRHPRVTITPHAAAWSSPAAIVPPMLEQIQAFERGEPLRHLVDRDAGY